MNWKFMQQKSTLYELRWTFRPVSSWLSTYGLAIGQLPVRGVLSNIYSETVVSEDNSEDELAVSLYIPAEYK
jgi:hypothetical protein